jgi:hypothetical protein
MSPLLLGLLLGCRPPAADPSAYLGPWHEGAPGIQGVELSCDPVDARWELRVRTDAWAAGAFLWMTEDGTVVEKHSAASFEAAEDGTEDCLRGRIGLAQDPGDAGSGVSRWLCEDAPALSFVLAVSDSRDAAFTDCRVWGADPAAWDGVSGPPACGRALDDGPDTGAVLGDEGDLGGCPF